MPAFPQRKSPRLRGYDYRQEGAYFVTICTHNRQNLFGEVVDSEMRLNSIGSIAQIYWENIPIHFPQVELDAFIVMPNHVHGIILIVQLPVGTRHGVSDEESTGGHGTAVSLQDYRPEGFGKPVAGSLSTVVRSYKSAVTRQVNRVLNTENIRVWQGRYHDHIIRSERSLNELREYILNNPARWRDDVFYANS